MQNIWRFVFVFTGCSVRRSAVLARDAVSCLILAWSQMLLTPQAFMEAMGMTLPEFQKLPEFRRRALKIKAKLHVKTKKKSSRQR